MKNYLYPILNIHIMISYTTVKADGLKALKQIINRQFLKSALIANFPGFLAESLNVSKPNFSLESWGFKNKTKNPYKCWKLAAKNC